MPSPEATTASTPTKAAAPATAKSAPASAKKVAPARKRPAPSAAKSATAPVAAKPATATKAPAPAPARKRVAAKKAPAASVVKKVKQKLVRDSFTMPSADFALIDQLKTRAIGFKRPAKKSELLRAGLKALSALSDAKLKSVLDGLTPLKAGRPKKNDA
ncbi:MAG: hypothetical protein EOP40_09620 [Rubrivivax sp.]|nr:MAG: hypothetical protein EOP40_09620 [Rubrivivax sp.]